MNPEREFLLMELNSMFEFIPLISDAKLSDDLLDCVDVGQLTSFRRMSEHFWNFYEVATAN